MEIDWNLFGRTALENAQRFTAENDILTLGSIESNPLDLENQPVVKIDIFRARFDEIRFRAPF